MARARARARGRSPVATAATPSRSASAGEPAVARAVVALERPLQLDAQVLAPEGGQQPPQRRLVVHAVARASAQADEPGGVLLEHLQRHRRRRLAVIARVRVRAREDAAEAAPALLGLHQQREVAAVVEVDLRPVDRLHPEPLGGLRELHRAAQPVVVGQREGAVARLGRSARQLLGQRGAVEEGEGGVGVQLGVHGSNTCSHGRRRKGRRSGGDMVLSAWREQRREESDVGRLIGMLVTAVAWSAWRWASRQPARTGAATGRGRARRSTRASGSCSTRGNGAGGWLTGTGEPIGTGWGTFTALLSPGDFSGDDQARPASCGAPTARCLLVSRERRRRLAHAAVGEPIGSRLASSPR